MIVCDATVLAYLLDPNAKAPVDLATGQRIPRCSDRVRYLVAQLSRKKARLIVPTPALAEVLVRAGPALGDWLRILDTASAISIEPFNSVAAIEAAAMMQERVFQGNKRPDYTRAKAKFDVQIVAIARTLRAREILSDDDDIRRLAGDQFKVTGIRDLPLPASETPLLDPLEGE